MNPLQPFINGPITHRTLHDVNAGRPENSYEGLDAAIAHELAVEIDLQLSSDGIPMVFHDYELDRLTGETGLISDRTALELMDIPLTGGKRGIPRFDEFLAHTAGRVPVLVELKDQDGALGAKLSELESAACEIMRQYDGAIAVMSFNPDMIARCAMLAPDVPRGIVTDPYTAASWPNVSETRRMELAKIPHYDLIGATFISHNRADLSAPRVTELKSQGATIFCWTIRTPTQEDDARKIVDSITFEGYMPAGIK
jgi:glycerophosphoryl diester phosphodiesterase